MQFDIIVGQIYGDISGFTEFSIFAFLCGFYKDVKKAQGKLDEFKRWMYGQTTALIDGEVIYYTHDFIRFMEGLPVAD